MTNKNQNQILIYHHNDLDGYAAAAAACNGMRFNAGKKADELQFTFVPIAFPTTWETFVNTEVDPKNYEYIAILDYGFTMETMNILTDLIKYVNATCKMLYWIDHHVTSIKPCDTLRELSIDKSKFFAFVSDERSAAWLAYEFFYPQDDDWTRVVPPIIKYVDDYDRWVHRWSDSVLINNAWYCSTELKDPGSEEWQILLDNWREEVLFEKLIEQGAIIEQYRNLLADSRKKFAYKVEIEGFPQYSAVALNDRGNSKCFSDLVKEYQVCVLYHENRPGEIAISLYSDPKFVKQGVNVSAIAMQHHGGGHPGAAGCSMSVEEFHKTFKPVK